MPCLKCCPIVLAVGLAAGSAFADPQSEGTNARTGSYGRGAHVYCPGSNPHVFCKPPAQDQSGNAKKKHD